MKYEGHANRDTWLLSLYSSNVELVYNIKNAILRGLDKEVTPDVAMVLGTVINKLHDLEQANLGNVDWEDLADTWETQRQELLCSDKGEDWPC